MSFRSILNSLKALVSDYIQLGGFVLALFAVWLVVRSTPNEPILYRLLLAVGAVVLGAFFVIRTWPSIRAAASAATKSIRRGVGIEALERHVASLRRENRRLTVRVESGRTRQEDLYAAGVAEGRKRERAIGLAPVDNVWPTTLLAEGAGADLVVIGTTSDPSQMAPGARATLVTIGLHRPLGVLEIKEVNSGGQVILIVADHLVPEYWDRIEQQSVNSPTTLGDGVTLSEYDGTTHHSNQPPPGTIVEEDDVDEEETQWQ